MDKRIFTMAEACKYLGGISRPTMYKLLANHEVTSLHIGARRFFTLESLNTFIDMRLELWEKAMDNLTADAGTSETIVIHK